MSSIENSVTISPEFEVRDLIRKALGRPYCEGDHHMIFNVDCLTALRELPDGLFSLTVTSPPYNIGKEYETPMPLDQYLDWCGAWIKEVHRCTTPTGEFFLNVGYIGVDGIAKAIPLPYLLWNRIPFFLIQEVVWNYGAGVAGRKFLSPRNEKLLWYVKDQSEYAFNLDEIRDPDVKYPNQKKNGKLRCNTIGKNPSDVWQIAKVTSGSNRSSDERAPHPAQFPLDLIDRVVKGFSCKGDLLLDPFIGSGTTAESAIRNKRFAVGFELRRDYCDYAKDRLRHAEAFEKSRLF